MPHLEYKPSEEMLFVADKPKPIRKSLLVTSIVLAVLTVVVVGWFSWQQSSNLKNFYGVQTLCDPAKSRLIVGDDGKTLFVNSWGGDSNSQADVNILACSLSALNAPDSVVYQVGKTSALSGSQTASWEGYSASWTFHPRTGLDMIVVQ